MLVEGFKGQKVQDVKKPIQKMMVEKVKRPENKRDVDFQLLFFFAAFGLFFCSATFVYLPIF